MDQQLPRRTFLASSAGAAAAAFVGCARDLRAQDQPPPRTADADLEPSHGLGAEEANSPTVGGERGYVRVMLTEADGSPLASERARLLHARDLKNDPLPQAIVRAEGRVRVAVAGEPLQVVCRLKVPQFGEVYVYADNEGEGYAKPGQIDFVVEAAKTRLHRVREAAAAAKRAGVPTDAQLQRHLEAAARPIPQEQGPARIAAAYEALAHGMHAGEMLALAAARHRIARLNEPRKDFGFGVMVSRWGTNPLYDEAVAKGFNFATVAWYNWVSDQPPYVDYAPRMDASIDYCLARNVTPKGFGYCYMARGATPEWVRPIETPSSTQATDPAEARRQYNPKWPYERVRGLYEHVNRQTARHYLDKYGDKVPYVEVLNEAHDKANLWHMSHEQVLDMARTVTRAAREGHPRIKRMINHCCQWAEYAVRRNPDGGRRWSPYRFAKDCIDNGAEFETLGLQLYYPQYDVFETDRMLQRHFALGKPIHITEMSAHAKPGFDTESMRPKTISAPWHGEAWSETTQADWLEAIYTLCYSHPQIEVAQWWDLADVGGHFWPHGGLLNRDMTPKESFGRLQKLQKRWGVARPAVAK